MPQITITQLPAAQTLTGTEIVPLVQGGVTVRAFTQQIANLAVVVVSNAYTTVSPTSGVYTPTAKGNYRILTSGSLQIAKPVGTFADGDLIYFWVTASGGSITLTLPTGTAGSTNQSGYVVPTTSTIAFPYTIASTYKARLVVQYDATRLNWELVQFIYGY
jgi:hypothetical protein